MTKRKPPEPEKPKRPRKPAKAKVVPITAMTVLPRAEPPGGVAEEVEEPAREGIYQPAHMGIGTLDDAHADEDAPENLRGRADDVDLTAIDKDWVLRRLVKEANDFGARTRQSSRLKALEMIGTTLGMFTHEEDPGLTEADKAAKAMTPEERRAKIRELSQEVMQTAPFRAKVQ